MSADYCIRFVGRVDGQDVLRRMQPLTLRACVIQDADGLTELVGYDGRSFEYDGVGTTIIVDVDKEKNYAEQRRQVLAAVQRVMDSGAEDFLVGYYDRPVIIRLNGVVERFHEPELTPWEGRGITGPAK